MGDGSHKPWSDKDWESARGLKTCWYNNFLLFVRSPVEPVARALAGDDGYWARDTLGKQVVVRGDSHLVFQLRNHPWTIAVGITFGASPYGNKDKSWEKALSVRLGGVKVMTYGVSDTCGGIGYTLIEAGEVVEDFWGEDGGAIETEEDETEHLRRIEEMRNDPNLTPDEILERLEEDFDGEGLNLETSFFFSTRREVDLASIASSIPFVEDFFVEQDAFEPGFDFDAFFHHETPQLGESAVVLNPRIVYGGIFKSDEYYESPVLERVDYVAPAVADERRAHLTAWSLAPHERARKNPPQDSAQVTVTTHYTLEP